MQGDRRILCPSISTDTTPITRHRFPLCISVQERRTIVALSLTRAARVELFTDTRIIGINGIVCIRELFVNAAYSHRRLY